MENINYTFIIPHKNIPDLLQRCLNSIPRRDDIQIIVVDDNSNPDKVDFEHFPGVGEPCVELYFTKEGKGAGYARNVGLRHAKGKWLLFADADDFYVENLLHILDRYLYRLEDIIYFFSESVYSDTGLVANRHIRFNTLLEKYMLNRDVAENRLRYGFIVPWSKMIRGEFIEKNDIKFEEVVYSNDVLFSVKSGYFAQEISVGNECIYCVTVSHGSLTNRYTKESLLCRYKVILGVNAFLRSINKNEQQCSIMYFVIFSLQYGIFAFVKFVALGIKSGANFTIGYKTWLHSFFKLIRKLFVNRKYVIKT